MVKTEHKIVRLSAADYIRDFRNAERIVGYCKECENYNTIWACPPYGFDTLERIRHYKYVHLIGIKVILDDVTRHSPTNAREQKEISYRIMKDVREDLDKQLLEVENNHPGTLAFFAGNCFICHPEECTRRIGKPCIHPEKARSSLEAYGFDISKTASELFGIELQWSENFLLPEYFLLVSGLFSDYEFTKAISSTVHKVLS